MKKDLVSTTNTVRIMEATGAIEQRRHDTEISGIALVFGQPGLGKTHTLRKYHVDKRMDQSVRSLWTRASVTWTESGMLRALLKAMGMLPEVYRKDVMREQLIDALRQRFSVFIVDEMDAIAESRKLISLLKEIHDESGCSFVLIGEERVDALIKRYTSFYNRINDSARVHLSGHTAEDVANVVRVRCEWPVDPEVCREIHRRFGSKSMRSVIDTIRKLESFARTNPVKMIGMTEYRRITGVRIELAKTSAGPYPLQEAVNNG